MTRRLNILLLSAEPPYPPTHGGARLLSYHRLKQLSPRHDFTLMTFLETPEDREFIAPTREFCKSVQVFERKQHQGKPTLRERFQAPFYRMVYTEEFAAALTRELATNKYNLVQVDAAGMAVYTPLLAGHKKVATPNDSITLAYRNRLLMTRGLKQQLRTRYLMHLVKQFEQRFYQQYDACIFVAEGDREEIRSLCPKLPVHVISLGIDLNYFRPGPPELEEEDRLVFTGTMDFGPNIDSACWLVKEILPRIHNVRPNVKVEIVGRNPTAEVVALGKHRHVTVTGFVPDLRAHVTNAAVYVCPMRFGSGMKNKMLEAMAMGKAIVTTPAGTSGIAAKPGQEYLVAEEPAAFAEAVLGLLADREKRRRLAQASRVFVEKHYTWERMAESYESVYLQVTAAGRLDAQSPEDK